MNTTQKIVSDELSKLGIESEKPKAKKAPYLGGKTHSSTSGGRGRRYTQIEMEASLFKDDPTPDFLKVGYKPKREATANKKFDADTMLRKLDVRMHELNRMMGDDFEMAHGKADATIKRAQWQEFTQSIAKYIGLAMQCRGLEWKSGHEWSLERGELVSFIEDFILDNAVYVDDTDRKYIISVDHGYTDAED